jgi:hypothetical protein
VILHTSKRRLFRLSIILIPLIIVFSQCFNIKKHVGPRGDSYAGSQTCVSCHKDIYNSYLHTAHFIASQPANGNTIQGSFAKGANDFVFNDHMKVLMEKRDSTFFQTSFIDGKPQQSQRFDIVFGGVKGQTYAYWVTNELFQLPISYITDKREWVNSPGYLPDKIVFERAVGTKCLDCHASYIKEAPPTVPGFNGNSEGFDKRTLIYGVDCERCHGPASRHVEFHTENPNEKQAKFIATFKSLTRDQKVNMCAICHSGANSHMPKPTFGYKPQDTLSKFMIPSPELDYKHIDVHGNQRGLLESSKCFIGSKMDCSTCHDTHIKDRGNTLLYTARCMACHNNDSHNICKLSKQLSPDVLKSNCIACHMPAFASKVIVVKQAGTPVHTHHVAIYPEETQKILAFLKSKQTVEESICK